MGGFISIIIIVFGAIYFVAMRLSGNKEAIANDDFAGGAAWFVVFVLGIFISLFILAYIRSYLDNIKGPMNVIAKIIIGLILTYIPYKIACLVAPTKEEDKNDNGNTE